MNNKRILLLSTGGTITMTSHSGEGIAPTLSGEDLVQAIPELNDKADLDVRSVSCKPGASLTLENLVEIATLLNQELVGEIDGAVVVQGTDTIEETAFVLDLLVDSDKPVIVTGAMRGPAAPGADGPANLLAAMTVATALNARGMGTLVVLNDEVHAARYVQKSHTALPSAFTSPLFGPIGCVIEGAFERYAMIPRSLHLPLPTQGIEASVEFLPPVALVKVALGDDGRLLPVLPSLGYRGAVIEGMGAGHLPASLAPMLATLAEKMPTVLVTRVTIGPTFSCTYQFPGSEMDLLARGAIHGSCLSGVKACLLLRMLLSCQLTTQELIAEYQLRSNFNIPQ